MTRCSLCNTPDGPAPVTMTVINAVIRLCPSCLAIVRKPALSLLQRVVNAAEHLGACDFAGEEIEFRCAYCTEARAVLKEAEAHLKSGG